MTKQDLIEHLTHNCGLQRSSAIRAVNGMISFVADNIIERKNVTLRGLGTFKIIETKERQGRNLINDMPITIPAGFKVKFIPSLEIRHSLKH